MHTKNPAITGQMKRIYAELAIDGRTKRGKRLARKWKELYPRCAGDTIKESLLLRLLKFENDNSVMTARDLTVLISLYSRLGLLPADAPDTTPSTNPLADYLEKNP